jgi:hypothetical protein
LLSDCSNTSAVPANPPIRSLGRLIAWTARWIEACASLNDLPGARLNEIVAPTN